ncbi:MAG TPA: DNA polymerase III subunit beta [Spirochaetota bacterium]|jgi:DNA polymerase-3 subunit beta|nr:MAG: DNA polymerase III subunit beta [Spirochaetes bacterium ADurb.Bin133]HNZ25609.1 DNA polymerase III subunit beta [Spirochaetota bacterium]HPY88002.1 DNA polymerase III subunit beta [Spirochaetota bacterium]
MKFICSKESILKILSIAESIISTRNSISILSNVLLEAKNNLVKITASETSITFVSEINAEILEEGSVSVYCNRLYTLVRKLSGNEIEIFSDEENVVTINPKENKKIEYKLKGIDSDKFPPVKITDDVKYFSIKQEIFTEMTKKTIFAISPSDNRKFINGVFFEKTEESIKMVSTDGKRLAFIKKELSIREIDNGSVIIPPKILHETIKLCSNNGDIQMGLTQKNVFIKIDNFFFISNLLDGNFPPYQKVIPTEFVGNFKIDRKTFLESLDRISLMGDKDSNKVILSIFDNELKIYTENITFGSGKEILSVDYIGNKFEIALNIMYLIDVLNVLSEDDVLIYFKDSQSTISVRQDKDNDYIYIMMPMTI